MDRTSWHPAAVQAIENELADSRKDLTIEAEHQLTSEPLRIDVLIIKKSGTLFLKRTLPRFFVCVTLSNSKVLMILLQWQRITKPMLMPGCMLH